MAFVLDANIRIAEILGLGKLEAALSKVKGVAQIGAAAGAGVVATTSGAGAAANAFKIQATAAAASAVAMNKATVATNKLNAALSQTATKVGKAKSSIDKASKSAKGFGHSIKIAGQRYAAFLAATVAPFAALAGIAKATAAVIEFDTAMLKVRQILGQTEQQVAGLRSTILDFASATGTSASELGRVAKVLSQAGLRGDELEESLSALAKVPLTPSFETMDAAIEGTIAALNQFNKEGLTTADVLDVMTALSNKFAASSEDIAKGISRGGAAFEAIGGTFKEFAAVFTTIRQATRESAETIGTFMKTISSRLADPKIVDFLEGKGIHIAEAIEAGDPVGALKQIATAMENITSIQEKIEIGTKLGGRRQISRLLALVSNIDVLDDALATASSSAGEFGKIAEEGLQGLQAQINIMIQGWNKLIQTLATPLFTPIIKAVTFLGKGLALIATLASPIIPLFAYLVGFSVGFKLLALSIANAAKALALMRTVGRGVGGGLTAAIGAGQAVAAGGAAGAAARGQIQRRLAGGVGLNAGQAVAAGGVGARLGKGAIGGIGQSSIGGIAIGAGLALAADQASEAFTKAGNSAGVFAAEAIKAASFVAIAGLALSGKGIVPLVSSFGSLFGPIAIAVTALGSLAYASNKAASFDAQKAFDEVAKKMAELEIEPIESGDTGAIQDAIGKFGRTALEALEAETREYENNLFDIFGNAISRMKNLVSGGDLTTFSNAEVQSILDEIVGKNPKLLNEIMKAAIEEIGSVVGLEADIEQKLISELNISAEYAARLRSSMVKAFGGMEKIAAGISQSNIETEVNAFADSVKKVQKDFGRIHIPIRLTNELTNLSDVIGRTVKAIENSIQLFDQLSQSIGTDFDAPIPEARFTKERVRGIIGQGDLSKLIPKLEGFEGIEQATASFAQIEKAGNDFLRWMLNSADSAADLSNLVDPKVDPLEIVDEMIQRFMKEFPTAVPPELTDFFTAAAVGISNDLRSSLVSTGDKIFDQKIVKEMIQSIAGKQDAFANSFVELITDFLNTSLDLTAKQVEAIQLEPRVLAEAQRPVTVLGELFENLSHFDEFGESASKSLNALNRGMLDIDDTMVGLAQDTDLVKWAGERYRIENTKLAEIINQMNSQTNKNSDITKGLNDKYIEQVKIVTKLDSIFAGLNSVIDSSSESFGRLQQSLQGYDIDPKAIEQAKKDFQDVIDFQKESLTLGRKLTDVDIALEISNILKKPADFLADELNKSASNIKEWTRALSIEDLQKGLKGFKASIVSGQVVAERVSISEARPTKIGQTIDPKILQTGVFGAEENIIKETLRELAVQAARRGEAGGLGEVTIADDFRNFSGSLKELIEAVKETGLNDTGIWNDLVKSLREQGELSETRDIDFIGAMKQTFGDLSEVWKRVSEQPELIEQPESFLPELTSKFKQILKDFSIGAEQPVISEAVPFDMEDMSTAALDIQRAASESRIAADATIASTTKIEEASIGIISGGENILTGSQNMTEAIGQFKSVVDTQREALVGPQETAVGGVVEGGAVEAVSETTSAVNALGEKMDAVGQAIQNQTEQEAERAADEKEEPIEIEGLKDNTDAVSTNSEAISGTNESMSELNEGMTKVAGAMEDGIGIDIETMSHVKIDLQGVAEAASEFTAEFEAVATRVAKEQINIVLQELARNAGNTESASNFESAIS